MEAKLIDLSKWQLSGGGAQGESFFSPEDPLLMLKLFHESVPVDSVIEEITISKNVWEAGVPAVEPGQFVTDGKRYGIIFRRVQNKKSFCTAVSKDPSCLEDMAVRLADMGKALHSMKADKKVFSPVTAMYRNYLEIDKSMTPDEKKACEDILEHLEKEDKSCTLVHGDFHYGNVITDGVKDYFIDLGTFGWGNPDFDNSMMFFVTHLVTEEMSTGLYHIDCATARRYWDVYKDRYFGPGAPSDDELLKRYAPYLLLRVMFFEATMGRDKYVDAYRARFMKLL